MTQALILDTIMRKEVDGFKSFLNQMGSAADVDVGREMEIVNFFVCSSFHAVEFCHERRQFTVKDYLNKTSE